MTLRMHAHTADWLITFELAEVSHRFCTCCQNSPALVRNALLGVRQSHYPLSTVLAQDHFFSDFLSLHLTIQSHKDPMMMLLGVGSRISPSANAADLMNQWSPPLSEWSVNATAQTHRSTH